MYRCICYGCNRRHDQGEAVCRGFSIRRDVVEARLLSMVREGMLSPQVAAEFEDELRGQVGAYIEQQMSATTAARRRLAQLDDEIQRIVDAMATVGSSAALASRLQASERERDQLAAEAREFPGVAIELPDVAKIYRDRLLTLNTALKREAVEARTALREILGRVDIELREGAQVWAKIETAPALLMALGAVANGGSGGQI